MIIEKRQFIRKFKPIAVKSKAFAYWYDAIYSGDRKFLTTIGAKKGYFFPECPDTNAYDDDLKCEINPPVFVYSLAVFIGISAYIAGSYLFS